MDAAAVVQVAVKPRGHRRWYQSQTSLPHSKFAWLGEAKGESDGDSSCLEASGFSELAFREGAYREEWLALMGVLASWIFLERVGAYEKEQVV